MRPLSLPLLFLLLSFVLWRPLPSSAAMEEEESSAILPAPQNVIIQSYNFENVLKWSPVKGINGTVTYRVEYRFPSDKEWENVTCTDITKPECDFDLGEVLFRIILRVRAEQGGLKSSWSQAGPFQAIKDTILGPPRAINVTTEANSLILRFLPLAYKGDYFAFRYRIYFWEESVGIKESTITKNTEKKFKNLKEMTVYCFQVQAIFGENEGQKSDTYCEKTTTTEATKYFYVILAFGIAFVAILAIFMFLWFIRKYKSAIKSFWQPPLRIPSHYEEDLQNAHAVMEFTSQNRAEEHWETVSVISSTDESQILRDSFARGNQVDISKWEGHR